DDLVAEVDALVADVDTRSGDELLDLLLRLSAERAFEEVATVSDACHVGPPAVRELLSGGRGPTDATGMTACPLLLHAQTRPRRTPHSPVPLSADTREGPRRPHVVDPPLVPMSRLIACQPSAEPFLDSSTSSMRPYSLAVSAERILSRSMSSLTCSGVR